MQPATTVTTEMSDARQMPIPRAPLWLGLAGLIPFLGMLALAAGTDGPQRTVRLFYLAGYGAIILSFVGALHWGVAMMLARAGESERWKLMTWSTVPALIGWATLPLPPHPAFGVLIAAYWVHFAMDRALARHDGVPGWYLPLRLILTSGATACLGLGLLL